MTTPQDPLGPIKDVTGRRSPHAAPPPGSERAVTSRVEAETARMLAEQRARLERDIRMGAVPVPPGMHGASLKRELDGVFEGLAREMKDATTGLVGGFRRVLAEATVRLDQVAREEIPATVEQTRQQRRSVARQPGEDVASAAERTAPPSRGETPTSDEMAARQTDRVVRSRASTRPRPTSFKAIVEQERADREDAISTRVGDFIQQRAARIQQQAPHLETTADGRFVHMGSGGEATAEEARTYARATKSAGRLGAYGRSLSESTTIKEGITKALPGGVVKAAGVAGVAYAVGNKVLDVAEAQRQQNDEFRAIQGGEGPSLLDGDAYAERGRMRRFALSNRMRQGFAGGMDEASANQLFMGASQLGLQGESRDRALDLGTENFRKYAMGVADSLRLITAASKNGQEGLQGIAASLEQVTEAAVRGGTNAKIARENYIAAFEQAAPMFTGQGTATAVAAGVAATTAGLGRSFEGVNFGGSLGDSMFHRRVAARQGKTYAESVLDSRGSEGAAEFMDTAREIRDPMIERQFTPEGRQALAEAAARARSEGRTIGEEELTDLAREHGKNINPDAMQALLAQSGVTGTTPRNAIQTAIASITGTADPGRETRAEAAKLATYEVSKDDLAGRRNEWGEKVGESDRMKQITERIGMEGLGIDWNLDNKEGQAQGARKAYLDQVKKTGKGSGLVEQLLSQGDVDQKFVVKAGNKGKDGTHDRVVSMEEAMKHFSDQMMRGDVKIAGTDMTLAESLGGEVDTDIDITSDKFSEKRHGAGRSKRNWLKEEGKKEGGGTVLISPAPGLERLLRFSGQGNVEIGATSPPNAHVPGAMLPTGHR